MNKKILAFVLGGFFLLLTAILVLVGWYYWQLTQPLGGNLGWDDLRGNNSPLKNYSKKDYELAFSYPVDWSLEETARGADFLSVTLKKEDVSQEELEIGGESLVPTYQINVLVEPNAEELTAEELYLKNFPENLRQEAKEKIQAISVNGLAGIEYEEGQAPANSPATIVLITNNRRAYRFTYSPLSEKAQAAKFKEVFDDLVAGAKIGLMFDESADQNFPPAACVTLLNNSVPLKDKQTFLDTSYLEVTITSRKNWDKNKLPAKVLSLEGQDYTCYPIPFEMEESDNPPGMQVQPAVKSVQWNCELYYKDYQYLKKEAEKEKAGLEKAGYECKKENCEESTGQLNYVWLCTK